MSDSSQLTYLGSEEKIRGEERREEERREEQRREEERRGQERREEERGEHIPENPSDIPILTGGIEMAAGV